MALCVEKVLMLSTAMFYLQGFCFCRSKEQIWLRVMEFYIKTMGQHMSGLV